VNQDRLAIRDRVLLAQRSQGLATRVHWGGNMRRRWAYANWRGWFRGGHGNWRGERIRENPEIARIQRRFPRTRHQRPAASEVSYESHTGGDGVPAWPGPSLSVISPSPLVWLAFCKPVAIAHKQLGVFG
jgi:hypothetical protein